MIKAFSPRRRWRGLINALNARRTEAALSALDDRMLNDIGLSRSDIVWRSRAANMPWRGMGR
jgi:uncharacterized protein YjiS (DUF1127 family)